MNSQQVQKPNLDQSPSFDDVSKLFSLPLSEAADILGVSAALLKKICNDNGLDRWPHRKYLAGKSIEQIKKEAATRERSKALATSSASQVKDKALQSPQEISKLNVQQQPGSRSVFTLRAPQHVLAPTFAAETSTCLDEFKYGFPSNGLSTSSDKWWGNASPADHNEPEPEPEPGDVVEPIVTLSAIRKRALEEGQEALEFGFWKNFGVEEMGEKDKVLLSRVFG